MEQFIFLMKFYRFFLLFIVSAICFASCNFSDKQGYNEGYKAGYTEGFNAASEKQNQPTQKEESNPTVADPNSNKNNREEVVDDANASIPQKAIVVLNYIREKNKAQLKS